MTTTTKQQAVEVGQIFYSSFGYDMTIVDFYEVERFTKASVWLRPIGRIVKNDDGRGNGTAEPDTSLRGPDASVFRKAIRRTDSGDVYLPDNSRAYGVYAGRPLYFNTWD